MSKRRMLNMDYYKLDAKYMVRSVEQDKQTYRIIESRAKRKEHHR